MFLHLSVVDSLVLPIHLWIYTITSLLIRAIASSAVHELYFARCRDVEQETTIVSIKHTMVLVWVWATEVQRHPLSV